MDIYLKKRRWKILLLIAAVLIGAASLLYTNWLTNKMALEELKNVELWANATEGLIDIQIESTSDPVSALAANSIEIATAKISQLETKYLTYLNLVTAQNKTTPIIVTQDDKIIVDANIKYSENRKDAVLQKELAKMKRNGEPIEIDLGDGLKQYLYYRDSFLLRNLRLFPVAQLFVIFLFIGIAYYAFNASHKAEQNQVWVGMSKETAHQLGTPISSLMAWIELLKMKDVDLSLIREFENDTQRLEKIAERFSKIGSAPELLHTDVIETIMSTVEYLKRRSSNKVVFDVNYDEAGTYLVPLNIALFSWVIENLCKNAIDAMDNSGNITISLKEKDDTVLIDIADTGKGISKSQHKTIFEPGFSTKKRGWGLGLSLARRIVENYHNGKIFIKQSELNKGTTFRIILKK